MNNLFLKTLLGRGGASKWSEVRDDDVFLVSYPKSGNTWLRFLVANLLVGDGLAVDLRNIEAIVPDIYVHNIYYFEKLKSPRIIKSHECFDPRYGRTIYIVRDPRDVALSYWHFQIKKKLIPEDCPLEEFIQGFIAGKVDPFGSWEEHVGCWLGARIRNPGFLLLKYEDLLLSPENELMKLALHLGLQVSIDDIKLAIENSAFNKLKTLEKKQGSDWVPLKGTNLKESFFRKGQSGNWRKDMPAHLSGQISQKWAYLLKELNYDLQS